MNSVSSGIWALGPYQNLRIINGKKSLQLFSLIQFLYMNKLVFPEVENNLKIKKFEPFMNNMVLI